ncbi:hypothetical protein GCM10010387_23010 [Streptomyces inusitatus]|uniref:Bacterial transcriptional activator domain-containing protein n=1 Tax=Streptomyces inusitatus TaxID=68221 RepID=A0A918Q061_9ACTN|nr:tetratricopeptide repeat protein [Streptomyces inusitatus]GGZ29117.1 hypothetical protein GCM10010387_23010 [Streptomyces inusitatus]
MDLVRYRTHLSAAGTAGSAPERLLALRSALGEVRGRPLEDLPGDGFKRAREELLAEVRETTAACVKTELECGETRSACDRVTRARVEWPESEHLLQLNVNALRALGEDGLIDPILSDWEKRTGRPVTHLLFPGATQGGGQGRDVTGPAPAQVKSRPRQLPAQPAELVGRQAEVDQIERAVLGRTPGRSRVAAIGGRQGVGKTFLAIRSAELVERHFPDGILYADLRGCGPGEPEEHGRVLARFLIDLGVSRLNPSMDGMVFAYRTELARRAVLLVLDNALDEDHVRPLLPGSGASAAIITSRRRLHGLSIREGAELVDVPLLDPEDSVELLRIRLGGDRARKALPFLPEVVEHCAGLPLALGITAARIADRPSQEIGDVVRELRQPGTRLRFLDLGSEDLNVRLSLDASVGQLTPLAVRLLWQLAIHPGPTASWEALRALEPADRVAVSDGFDNLIRMNLVDEPIPDRYSLHDLIRVYARELADRQDENQRAAVVDQMLHFLLHNAWACDRKLDPGRRLPIDPDDDAETVAPNGVADAMAWFEAEYPTLTAAVELAQERGLDRYTWLLSMTLVTFQWRTNRYLDALAFLPGALAAAAREAGPADVAMVHRMLAGTYRGLRNLGMAVRELRSAVRVSDDGQDIFSAAHGRYSLGVLLRESGVPAEALKHFTDALAAFEQLDDPLGQGAALNGIGNLHYDAGRLDEGLEHCRRSLALLDPTDDLNGRAYALFSLGRIRVAMEEHGAAVADFEGARDLYRVLIYQSREARTLIWLAEALNAANRAHEALDALQEARFLLERLGERDIDAAVERERRRW